MRRRAFLGLCGAALAATVRQPEVFAQGNNIVVGLSGSIFPGLSDAALSMAARPFRALLETATGVNGTVVQGGSPRQLADKLSKDQAQLGVFQGVEFAWAKAHNDKLLPLVLCVNQTRTVRAYLIVRTAWKGTGVADLEGRALVLPVETREHCRAFLERQCVVGNKTPRQFYKSVATADDAEEAIDEVCDSNATATVVDGAAWAAYRRAKPARTQRLRALAVSDPFPASVVACQSGRFDAGQVAKFRAGLIAAGETPRGQKLMEFLRMTGFEAVPGDFDRLLADVVRAYPAR